jgi:hypothetical protein
VTADEGDEWGFVGFARAMTIGATLGGVAGYAAGYCLEPSPRSTLFGTSGALWGTVIGSMYGYGASEEGVGYSVANDSASLGGFIGLNAGLGAAAALSVVWMPSYDQLGWMWAGAGLGAAVSLPVYLLYVGEDAPPAKRGLIFTGTATLVGIAAGAVLAPGSPSGIAAAGLSGTAASGLGFRASVTHVAPMVVAGGMGVQVGGVLW